LLGAFALVALASAAPVGEAGVTLPAAFQVFKYDGLGAKSTFIHGEYSFQEWR
jgi:hypothetical protein